MTTAVHRVPIEHPQDIWWRRDTNRPWKRVISYQQVASSFAKSGDGFVHASNQAPRTDAADVEVARVRTEHWNLFGGMYHQGAQPPQD
jgi:hypothetical protein